MNLGVGGGGPGGSRGSRRGVPVIVEIDRLDALFAVKIGSEVPIDLEGLVPEFPIDFARGGDDGEVIRGDGAGEVVGAASA